MTTSTLFYAVWLILWCAWGVQTVRQMWNIAKPEYFSGVFDRLDVIVIGVLWAGQAFRIATDMLKGLID